VINGRYNNNIKEVLKQPGSPGAPSFQLDRQDTHRTLTAMPVRRAYLCQLQACGQLTLVTVSGPVVLINYCALQVPGGAAPLICSHGDTTQGTALDVYGPPGALRL